MKCIYCNTDSKYRDRANKACPACKHPFAFEPKYTNVGGIPVTDGLFHRAIEEVSGKGTVAFTEKQLYYEFNRRLLKKQSGSFTPTGWGITAAGLAVGGLAMLATGIPWIILGGIVGAGTGAIVSRVQRRKEQPGTKLSFGAFQVSFLNLWIQVHGRPERLMLPAESAPRYVARPLDPDLTAYSFDRALVTDSPEIAAMLVANNFHFENNCAILSTGHYPPEPLRDIVLEMLRGNPRLQVFALHDASAEGCDLPNRLREKGWFPDKEVRIIDLGLRPSHAQKMRLIAETDYAAEVKPRVREILTPDEVKWLEALIKVDLAVIRPERLMRSVYQGFARAGQLPAPGSDSSVAAGGDVAYAPGFIWIHDGGADLVASDSFG